MTSLLETTAYSSEGREGEEEGEGVGEREEEGRGRDEKTRTLPTKAGGCRSRRSSGDGAAEGDEGDSPFPPSSEALSTSRLVLLLLFPSGRAGSNSTSKSEAEGR